jgi:hypothetical protein
MAITVKHSKVSTIPDDADTSLVRPSDWNADHTLVGTVPVANGGTGAATLTGYVKGNGTANMTAAATIPSTDITGLGTMAAQNSNNISVTGGSISGTTVSGYIPTTEKAAALGVATLDAGGTVPLSQIPASIQGGVSYQGTWNASTNTPTLSNGVGTKGYYYVVSVAGNTNLDGITSWNVGDWAIFNGTVWQKVDNTDAVTSVNGYTGTVVLTQTDISGTVPTSRTLTAGTGLTGGGDLSADRTFAIDSTVATLTGTQTLTNKTLTSPKINEILDANGNEVLGLLSTASATDYLSIKNGIGVGVPLHISSEGSSANIGLHIQPKGTGLVTISDGTDFNKGIRFRSSGSAASAITLLDAVSSAGHVVTLPDATTTLVGRGTTDTLTNKSISGTTNTLTDIGNASLTNSAITINGTSTSLGGSINVGTVTSVTGTAPVVSSGGATPAISLAASYGDTQNPYASKTANFVLAAPNGSAGVPTFRAIVAADIPTLNQSTTGTASNVTGTVAIANGGTGATTAPTARTALGATTVGGNMFTLTNPSAITFPRFNADNTVSALDAATFRTAIGAGTGSGTVTSVSGTGTVNGISLSGTVTSSGNLTLGGTLDLSSPPAIGGTAPNTVAATTITATTSIMPVTDNTGVVGDATFTWSNGQFTNFTVDSTLNVRAAIDLADSDVLRMGSSDDWALYYNGTTNLAQVEMESACLGIQYTDNGTEIAYLEKATGTFEAKQLTATNGIVTNSKTVSASFTIPATDNASSAGPITIASGVVVTVSSGSRWVVS